MSQIWAGATDFLTVAGSHLFGSEVQEISGCINTLCIILYKTAPIWLHTSLKPAMHVQWPHCTDPHGLTATQVLYIVPLCWDGFTSQHVSTFSHINFPSIHLKQPSGNHQDF